MQLQGFTSVERTPPDISDAPVIERAALPATISRPSRSGRVFSFSSPRRREEHVQRQSAYFTIMGPGDDP